MEKTLLFKVSLSKGLGCWQLLQSKISHLSPSLCRSPKGTPKKGIGLPQVGRSRSFWRVWTGGEEWVYQAQKGGQGLRIGDRDLSLFEKHKATALTA